MSIDHNMDVQCVQYQSSFATKLESVRLNIGSPVVRTDGRAAGAVRSRDYQIFSDG